MTKRSAGLLVHRTRGDIREVFLVHPGGPFFRNKDDGAWSIPKGEFRDGEDALAVARREFEEETGRTIDGRFVTLTPIRQRGGKVVQAFAVEGDVLLEGLASNTFTIEWPPRSGRMQSFPEVDRYGWFALDEARRKINDSQRALLDELTSMLR